MEGEEMNVPSIEQLTIACVVARLRQFRADPDNTWIRDRLLTCDLSRLEAMLTPETRAWQRECLETASEVAAEPTEKRVLCFFCKKAITGRVYFQGDSAAHPVHKNCRMRIRRSKDGGI